MGKAESDVMRKAAVETAALLLGYSALSLIHKYNKLEFDNGGIVMKKLTAFEEKKYPNWYWPYGLHDAEVKQINELVLSTDWKAKSSKYNCLEILVDAKGSRTSHIKKIKLFNYKVLSGNLPDKNEKKIWWLGDTLTVLANLKYHLELFLEQENGDEICLKIEFDIAEVE